ncbi:MAG: E3 binding domain-containing protein, partial [Propionibacteriales bacterium]|nr:E3 binding domain-containing protein [Propionibacteriales bacterium]
MSTEVTLPALGESVTEGTVSRWLKQVGDTVEADEALLEVSTDKVDTEIPSPSAGTLLEIKVEEDETVEVGAVLAVIGDADESGSDDGQADSSADEPSAEDASSEAPSETSDEEGAQAQEEQDARRNTEPVTEGGSDDAGSGEADASSGEGDKDAASAPKKSSGGAASGTEVTLPELGESVTEGTVSRWLKQVGDTVDADEPLLEVSTDKVDTEIPSPTAGTLLEIKVNEDETVEVGAVLAVIGDADASNGSDDSGADTSGEAASGAGDENAGDSGQGDEIGDQAEAGDEGGQDPIPAPTEAPKAEEKTEPAKKPETEKKPVDEAQAAEKPASKAEPAPKAAPRAAGGDDTYVTPLVRKLANEHGVELGSITGTGVG